MIDLETEAGSGTGYLAVPAGGTGPAVLVLHAWWGLNDVFKQFCEQLAAAGFVAFAPDMFAGKVAETVEEAEQLAQTSDPGYVHSVLHAAVAYLGQHPAVEGSGIGEIGFSFGGYWAILLSTLVPDRIAATVIFYGNGEGDFSKSRAAYLGHFAEADPFEPQEGVDQLERALRAAGREVTFHTYPGTGHWFCEPDRPDAFQPEAAALAWERTVAFLREQLARP